MAAGGASLTASGAATAAGKGKTLLALALGWAVPGLGHVLLGRAGRGVLFFLLVASSFALGLAHDGRLALRDSRQGILTTLQLVANAGVGPADLLARMAVYGEPAYVLPEDPSSRRLVVFRDRTRSAVSIYGTAYLWTAGLMNLLILFDVWDIARGRRP